VKIGVIASRLAQAGSPCDTLRMEYVSRVPSAPLDGLRDDFYTGAGRLISYKSDGSRHANFGGTLRKRREPWAR